MADKKLFPRLKRLFSTDVVIRNQGGDQLKVMDVNKIQQSGEYETNSLVDRFNRVYTNAPNSLYGHQSNINYQTLRPQLYSEYEANEVAADQKYEGKILRVQGTVAEIGKDVFFDTPPYVTLGVVGGFDWYLGVVCFFNEENEVAQLSKGDTITVQGRYEGYLLGVSLEGCYIVSKP